MIPKPISIYFLITISSLVLSQRCSINQFFSTNIDGCADCPADPKSNCQYEGNDLKSCELYCIQVETPSNQTSSGSKVVIPVSISAAVFALVLIALAVYFYKKTRQQGHPVENEDTENQNGERNESRYIRQGTALDLNKTNHESMSSVRETTL